MRNSNGPRTVSSCGTPLTTLEHLAQDLLGSVSKETPDPAESGSSDPVVIQFVL